MITDPAEDLAQSIESFFDHQSPVLRSEPTPTCRRTPYEPFIESGREFRKGNIDVRESLECGLLSARRDSDGLTDPVARDITWSHSNRPGKEESLWAVTSPCLRQYLASS